MVDLIDECGEDLANLGYESKSLGRFGATSCKLFVESKGKAEKLGFARGHYFVLNVPMLSSFFKEHRKILLEELKEKFEFLWKLHKIKKSAKVLFVGIGNPAIVSDSFGVKVVEKIEIFPFKKNNRRFKISPNIFANTGINSYDIIRVIVEAFDISVVVLFDSLATTNLKRLGRSIQLNDVGLTPGSALNNFGHAINKQTLNVPCFSIGVPMMISTKSFGEKNDVILTEKDVEEKVEFLSAVVAEAVGGVASVNL